MYFLDGKTSLTLLIVISTCLIESIIFSLSSKIILLYFPISSTANVFFTMSPKSSIVSNVKFTILSSPIWLIDSNLAPIKYFLSTIQNWGAFSGLFLFSLLKWSLQLFASIEIKSFTFFLFWVCKQSQISFLLGTYIFSTRLFISVLVNSFTTIFVVIPSNAIFTLPFKRVLYHLLLRISIT